MLAGHLPCSHSSWAGLIQTIHYLYSIQQNIVVTHEFEDGEMARHWISFLTSSSQPVVLGRRAPAKKYLQAEAEVVGDLCFANVVLVGNLENRNQQYQNSYYTT